MRKVIYIFTAVVALLSSCGATAQIPDDQSSKEVMAAVAGRRFEVSVRTILPQIGMPIHDTGYFLRIEGDMVSSHLPFFGTSDTAVYGSADDSSISLENYKTKIKEKKNKEKVIFSFDAVSGNNKWAIEVEIWNNGQSYISCRCTSKSLMRYEGSASGL